MDRTGVLFVGSLGYIASAVVAGAAALRAGLADASGLVTELKPLRDLGLAEIGEFVFGGWDIRRSTPGEGIRALISNAHLSQGLFPAIDEDIRIYGENIFGGVATNCGKAIEGLSASKGAERAPLSRQVDALRRDIEAFRKRNSLAGVIVVNLASTEPPLKASGLHNDESSLKKAIEGDMREHVRASTLYAFAAISEGCPYVNFTPSNGALLPGMIEFASSSGVPVMGDDGKTGETLVKSALIPMFMNRNLEILSWEGFNILGNMDGRVLDEPENRESKILSKDRLLPMVLGYAPHSRVHINYVPSLDDMKTAWNFIHFKGFMGVKMSLQFIWQGYDSILAAPLVLDLVRLSELSRRRGESGLMTHLSSFFKAPLGTTEHRFYEQFGMLMEYAHRPREEGQPDGSFA